MSGILDPLISALGGGGAATSSAASPTGNPTSTIRQATSSAARASSSAPAPASSSPSPSPSPSPSTTSAAPSGAEAPSDVNGVAVSTPPTSAAALQTTSSSSSSRTSTSRSTGAAGTGTTGTGGVQALDPNSPAGGGNTGSDSTSGLAIGGGIVAGLAMVAVGVILLVYRRRRKRKSDAENFRSSARVNKAMSSSWLSDSEPGTGSGWLGGRSPATTIATAEYITAAGNHIHEGYQGSNSGSQQHNIMSDVRLPSPTSTGMQPSTTYTSSLPPSKISSGFMSQSLGWNLHTNQNQNQLSIPPSLASYPPSTVANYLGSTEPSTSLSAANITALTRTFSGFSKDSTSTITPSNFRSRKSKIQDSSQLSPRTNSSFRYSQGSLSNFRVPASVALSWSSRSQIGGTDSVSWKKGGVRERWEVRQGALYVVQESRDSSGRGLLSVRAGDVVLVVGLPIDGWIEARNLRTSQLGLLAPSALFCAGWPAPEEAPAGVDYAPPRSNAASGDMFEHAATKIDVVRYAWWAGGRYFVQRSYEANPQNPDEIDVTPGTLVEIMDIAEDDWLQGNNLTTNRTGYFPAWALFAADGEDEAVMAL